MKYRKISGDRMARVPAGLLLLGGFGGRGVGRGRAATEATTVTAATGTALGRLETLLFEGGFDLVAAGAVFFELADQFAGGFALGALLLAGGIGLGADGLDIDAKAGELFVNGAADIFAFGAFGAEALDGGADGLALFVGQVEIGAQTTGPAEAATPVLAGPAVGDAVGVFVEGGPGRGGVLGESMVTGGQDQGGGQENEAFHGRLLKVGRRFADVDGDKV